MEVRTLGKFIDVKLTLTEKALGTSPADEDIYRRFIGEQAPDKECVDEEVEALGENTERGRTVFPRDENGNPFLWDYQIKGFFKDACKSLKAVDGTLSSKEKAYKKMIDGLVFIGPRKIVAHLPKDGEVGEMQRPLRASTPQGERVSLACSETIPEGTTFEFRVQLLDPKKDALVREWLDYGALRGLLQWRNAGFGRFEWEEV